MFLQKNCDIDNFILQMSQHLIAKYNFRNVLQGLHNPYLTHCLKFCFIFLFKVLDNNATCYYCCILLKTSSLT